MVWRQDRKARRTTPARIDADDWVRICTTAEAGQKVTLDSLTISTEQFAQLLSEATHDREYKAGPSGQPTFAPGSIFAHTTFEPGTCFHSLVLKDCDFSGTSLIDADFYQAVASKTDLSRSDLSNAIFISTRLSSVNAMQANLTNTKFYRAGMSSVKFTGADLTKSSFREAILYGCDFAGTSLVRTNFRDASLIGCNFDRASLTNTSFRDATLTETSFLEVSWDPAHPPMWPSGYAPPPNSEF